MNKKIIQEALIRSLLSIDGQYLKNIDVLSWIQKRNQDVKVNVTQIPFSELNGWNFNVETSNLQHDTGAFFSIMGVDVYANNGTKIYWQQPLINQPEIGYLGIIVKIIEGVLYFLLQSKIEPGNVNNVQLSPTLQATRSNYQQMHGGKKPAYLEYFQTVRPELKIVDQLQSEQGSNFFRKRNRNMIIFVEEDIHVYDDFCWLTLGQMRYLMRYDNVVNMDTRTVLSALSFDLAYLFNSKLEKKRFLSKYLISSWGEELLLSEVTVQGVHSTDDLLHWISELKAKYELVVNKIPLKDVKEWHIKPNEIVRDDRDFFRVLGVHIMIENREVATWCQPIIQSMQEGLCVLFLKKIHGVIHLLIQAKIECGNFDVVELAPTIQCLTGNFLKEMDGLPYYLDDFSSGEIIERVLFDTRQSEEGGRFYHDQNRYVICLIKEDVNFDLPDNFNWLTLGQTKDFLRFNNYFNIQVRSLIASLEYC